MKKKQVIIFVAIFFVAIISTINFLKPHYAIDTIEFIENGYESYINSKFLVDGRIFSVLLLKLVINMPMKYVIPILYVIGILISSISVMYTRDLIIKYGKKESQLNIIPTIIAYVIIFNFMYIDTFQFMEFPIIAISVLLYIIAAKTIIEREKSYILKSMLLVIIAMFCYQGTISVLIVTAFVLTIIKNEKINKSLIIDMLKVAGILTIAVMVNYLFTVLVGGTRRLEFDLIKNIKYSLINLYLLIFNSGLHYPQHLQLIFVITIITYCTIKKVKISNLIYIYVVSIAISIIMLIIVSKNFIINQYGRVLFSIGATVGYMFMYLWCTNELIKNSKFFKGIISIYFISILITYFGYTYFYMKGQDIDKYLITNIDKIITEYEEKTGTEIKKFAYAMGKNEELFNTSYILKKEYNGIILETLRTGRRTIEQFNSTLFYIYADRKIERSCDENNILKEYIENNDLAEVNDFFDQRRFIFIDDTVYIVF